MKAPSPMRISQSIIAAAAFAVALGLAVLVSAFAALGIERRSVAAVTSVLLADGITWAEVAPDGLQVRLTGTAPDEAARFRAVNLVASVVDATRIRDRLEVAPVAAAAAPRFSLELLRNDDGIQLIGLLPDSPGEQTVPATEPRIAAAAAALLPEGSGAVIDMLETAAYPAPAGWDTALDFGLQALAMLPRSKISVAAGAVSVTAISDSAAQKRRLEADLARLAPKGVTVTLDISAPRPVLTPFTLRFVRDGEGARFDACAADSEPARDRIAKAAADAGVAGPVACTVGLGVPTPAWADATVAGIRAVADLGSATITFSDADVSLLAAETTPQATFDRVVGELEAALPEVFSLDATLPRPVTAPPEGPAEFTASLKDGSRVEMRGRLANDLQRSAVDAYARARFGGREVYLATRLDEGLPDGWPVRVLAGLEALGELATGTLLVREDTVEVAGVSGSQGARARIAQVLSARLGQGQTFRVDVTYDEALDPLAALPTPQECAADLSVALETGKITFTPGSAEIAATAMPTMTAIAAVLTRCVALPIEIAGHTDAQGSDGGNLALSQARAEAVLLALQGRRVDTSMLKAVGYGETQAIAPNDTEAGREANRRIEFTLTGAAGPLGTGGPTSVATVPNPGAALPPPVGPPGAAAPPLAAATTPPDASAETVPNPVAEPVSGPVFGDGPSLAPSENRLRPRTRPAD